MSKTITQNVPYLRAAVSLLEAQGNVSAKLRICPGDNSVIYNQEKKVSPDSNLDGPKRLENETKQSRGERKMFGISNKEEAVTHLLGVCRYQLLLFCVSVALLYPPLI